MTRRAAILLPLFIALAGCVLAQTTAPSDSLRAAYNDQFMQLNRAYVENPRNVATLYDLSVLYSDTLNPAHNLPLAMEYISRAEALYLAMVNSNKSHSTLLRLLKRNIKLETIRLHKRAVIEAAREAVTTDALTDSEINRYAEAFKGNADVTKDIKRQRVRMALAQARQQNTVDALYNFERRYAGTAEADSVEAEIVPLASALFERMESEAEIDAAAKQYELSPAVQQCARSRKSKIAYSMARMRHTSESYRAFLSAYPSSNEYMQALDELEAIVEAEYNALTTPQDYIDFIKHNSDDPLADEAMEKLYRTIKEERNVAAAKAYLANFPLDVHYNDIYLLFYQWHAYEGNLQPIADFSKEHKDFPFQMALKADLGKAAQVEAFDLTRPYEEKLKDDYVSFIRYNTGKGIAFVALQRMIQPLKARRDWKGAYDRMGAVMLSFDEVNKDEFDQLRELLTTESPNKSVAIYSTKQAVRHPVLHPDGKQFFYSQPSPSGMQIMVAQRNGKQWSKPAAITFSNAENMGMEIFCLYDNGERMLLGKDGDIWIAQDEGDSWRVIEIPPYPLNTDYVETDAYMLPDGTGILLASDRPDGHNLQRSRANYHGDTALATDIYFVPHTLKGWGQPINLGVGINTMYGERSPILSRNQQTLYFISDGYGGFGYGDIMMATRASTDGWTRWSTPVNIGREANSCFDEASIAFDADETHLIASSNRSHHRYEAYAISVWHNAENPTRTLKLDARQIGSALAKIDVADFTLQGLTREIRYPNTDKPIELNLFRGKRYVIYGQAAGHYIPPLLITSATPENARLEGYNMAQLLRRKEPIALSTVSFDALSSEPKAISMAELDHLASFMNDNPSARIELIVTAKGNDKEKCYQMSLERAQNLRRYICSKGVEIGRIHLSAYGNVPYSRTSSSEVMIRFVGE